MQKQTQICLCKKKGRGAQVRSQILSGSWTAAPLGSYGRTQLELLTVQGLVPAAAIAANVLYLFPDVTVDRKGHVVVVVQMVAVVFLVAQRHDLDQAEALFLGLLHGHGRVFSAPRGNPSTAHDGGCGVHGGIVSRPEHGDVGCGARRYDGVGFKLKHQSIESDLIYSCSSHSPPISRASVVEFPPRLYLRSGYVQATLRGGKKVTAARSD